MKPHAPVDVRESHGTDDVKRAGWRVSTGTVDARRAHCAGHRKGVYRC